MQMITLAFQTLQNRESKKALRPFVPVLLWPACHLDIAPSQRKDTTQSAPVYELMVPGRLFQKKQRWCVFPYGADDLTLQVAMPLYGEHR